MILFFGMPFVAIALMIAATVVVARSLRGAICWPRIRQFLYRGIGTVTVCVAIVAVIHRGTTRHSPRGLTVSVVMADEEQGAVSPPLKELVPTASADLAAVPDESESADEHLSAERSQIVSETADNRTADDETMVLFLSRKDLRSLLSGDATGGSATLDELHRFYAMVPLSTTGPQAVPPVLRQALSPLALRQVLRPDNLKLLAGVLTEILAVRDDSAPTTAETDGGTSQPLLTLVAAEGESPTAGAAESAYHPANWVKNPGLGQVVVESEFLEASTPPEEALRDSVLKALHQDVDRVVHSTLGPEVNWQTLVNLKATDNAIRRCIISTDKRTEVIETAEGAKSMQKTYALVEFPDAMTAQILNDVESELRINRLLGLCVGVALLWVMAILFSAACRATQHGPLFRRLAAFPLIALFLLPCLLAFAFVLGAMISGATFEFKSEQDRVSCLVDEALIEDAAH